MTTHSVPTVVSSLILFIMLSLMTAVTRAEEKSTHIGSTACKNCHVIEYEQWSGSDHQQAMAHATQDSVLGDFSSTPFSSPHRRATFFKKEDAYYISIIEGDGEAQEYEISYTFGVTPLQQYMVEFPDGRIQLLPFAWDSRTAEEGGQRWFDLYPDFVTPSQEFYWKSVGQNWNYMCADCHSTNYRKNYSHSTNTYQSTWAEISVGCEACHGEGALHSAWANGDQSLALDSYGFDRTLSKSIKNWVSKEGHSTLVPGERIESDQVVVCGQCHSRHTQISDSHRVPDKDFGDRYLLSLVNSRNYFQDGNVKEEAFVYGSYLQSKMHQNGVSCSNCHNPHSGALVLPKEQLCLQCHESSEYTKQAHHGHETSSVGAQCVNCHMPETTFMEIDNRADHSWSIPRPSLSLRYGTPDTCLNCHADKNSVWSNDVLERLHPDSSFVPEEHFANAFTLADSGYPSASLALTKIAQNTHYPPIIRASALERMKAYPDRNSLVAIARGARDKSSLVRAGAIQGAANIPLKEIWPVAAPLLDDPVLSVRAETANMLVTHWQKLGKDRQEQIGPALEDYKAIQTYNADRGFSHANLATVYAYQGKIKDALSAYDRAINVEPAFEAAYINKAELLRSAGRTSEEYALLMRGIKSQPNGAGLHYALGLNRIRAKDKAGAVPLLRKATVLNPNNAQFFYVYALSLEGQVSAASAALRTAYNLSANPQHLYALCELQVRNNTFQAKKCLSELSGIAPEKVVDALRNQLKK